MSAAGKFENKTRRYLKRQLLFTEEKRVERARPLENSPIHLTSSLYRARYTPVPRQASLSPSTLLLKALKLQAPFSVRQPAGASRRPDPNCKRVQNRKYRTKLSTRYEGEGGGGDEHYKIRQGRGQ